MNINDVLPTISTFSGLRPIIEQAEVKLSYWGCRYVHVNGYEGLLPIDALAGRVMEMVKQRQSFSDEEWRIGILVARRIDNIYSESDELVKQSDCLTKALAHLIDAVLGIFTVFLKCSSTTRGRWEGETGCGAITHFPLRRSN